MNGRARGAFAGIFIWIIAISFMLAAIAAPLRLTASAATSYEDTAVEEDLIAAGIDPTSYKASSSADSGLVYFTEYCYSYVSTVSTYYGVYLYVYNATGSELSTRGGANTVNMAIEYDGAGEPTGYANLSLTICDHTEDYLLYKFRITNASGLYTRAKAYALAHEGVRRYDLAGVQLWRAGETLAEDHAISTTYRCTGFAEGCSASEESTLQIFGDTLETLSLNAYTTAYRPSGSNGKGDCTQDSLHSIYFAVPNRYIEKYGEMYAIHATWLNAVLAPALVTGNKEAYDAIIPYLGQNIGRYTDELDFHYYGDLESRANGGMGNFTEHIYGFGYNGGLTISGNMFYDGDTEFVADGKVAWSNPKEGYDIDTLYTMYYAGSGTDSADSYEVSSDMIRDKLLQGTESYGGELVNGKYGKVLFERVDETFTEVNIRRDETFDLTSQTISKSWWDKLWNLKGDVSTTVFDGIQAIYPVTKDDLLGTKEEVCKRLYISTADYDAFKKYFEENKETATVYLFRYQVSDYIAQEATLYQGSGVFSFKRVDTNAYFFQETVNLDFDIIDVTFFDGEEKTVIPVVMSPIDHIPSATPPINTTSDGSRWWLWCMIAGGVLLMMLVVVMMFYKAEPTEQRVVVKQETEEDRKKKRRERKEKER